MGLAYTLSKSEGIQGYDWATEELFGEQGLRDRYYGPPTVTTAQLTNITGITRADRRHVLVVHYSYEVPTLNIPVLKTRVGDWLVYWGLMRMNDLARAELAQYDRGYLIAELTRAAGLGGRNREVGGTAERARTSVTRSLRYALARLAEQHAALATHLRQTVRTGTYCAYTPDPLSPTLWRF